MKHHYKKIKQLYSQYERFLIPGMLVLGFLVDIITFKTLNISTAFILLGIHAFIVGFAILFLNSFDEGIKHVSRRHPFRYLLIAAPLMLQFSFGALLSAVMIFYLFSGALSASWPFLIIIALLMVSNEIFREYYLQPSVQLPVYYFILFTLGTVGLAFVFKTVSLWLFVIAGLLAMLALYGMYRLLLLFIPAIEQEGLQITGTVGLIYGVMLALYLTNIIPPVPLSVRDIGVYHNVQRAAVGYQVSAEKRSIWEIITPGTRMDIVEGKPLSVFTAVFAPTDLKTSIVHNWEWHDPTSGKWISQDVISYNITGGRDNGYRGYTTKHSLREGKWRVSAETSRGQVIGRFTFKIRYVEEAVPVEIVYK